MPGCARLILIGHKVNGPLRLSPGKLSGGAVEGPNPPHRLVSLLSKRNQARHQRKRESNGFHPHNLSTQRSAGHLCEAKFVNPVSRWDSNATNQASLAFF